MNKTIEVWMDGFLQGQKLSFRCPVPAQAVEIRLWRRAWLEGAAKMLGLQYQALPTRELFVQLGYAEAV